MTAKPHKALVIGATGYTGRAIVPALRQRGVDTVAHVRSGSSGLQSLQALCAEVGARCVSTSWDQEAIHALFDREQPSVVFALLGTTRSKMREAQRAGEADDAVDYMAIDYGLTHRAFEASEQLEHPPRFVYLSAMGVGPGSRSAYMKARWAMEKVLRESSASWTIAQPGFITGPDREESRPMERIGATVFDGVLRTLGALGAKQLKHKYLSLDAQGLAEGLVHWGLDPAGHQRVVGTSELRRS